MCGIYQQISNSVLTFYAIRCTTNESYSQHVCNIEHVFKYFSLTPSNRVDYYLGSDSPWGEHELHFVASECSLLPAKLSDFEPYPLSDKSIYVITFYLAPVSNIFFCYSQQPWEIYFTEIYNNYITELILTRLHMFRKIIIYL